jgi:hypothetical protein
MHMRRLPWMFSCAQPHSIGVKALNFKETRVVQTCDKLRVHHETRRPERRGMSGLKEYFWAGGVADLRKH